MSDFKPKRFFFLVLVLLNIYFFIGIPQNNIFLITNFLILLFSFLRIFSSPLIFYSLFKIVFIFIFVFFGIHPLINEVNDVVISGDTFDVFDKVKANLFIFSTSAFIRRLA